jgi:hypothetical protein
VAVLARGVSDELRRGQQRGRRLHAEVYGSLRQRSRRAHGDEPLLASFHVGFHVGVHSDYTPQRTSLFLKRGKAHSRVK